jgi:hypothetical protein
MIAGGLFGGLEGWVVCRPLTPPCRTMKLCVEDGTPRSVFGGLLFDVLDHEDGQGAFLPFELEA